MHIETYVIEETAELIYETEKLDEWNKIVNDLGLSGQNKTLKTDKSPIPFLPMNTKMENIFKTLCPSKELVERYNITPIPLEVLKLISLSRKELYFGDIEIWYDEQDKDPICVGYSFGVFVDNASGSKQSQYGSFQTKETCQKFIEDNNLIGHKPYSYGGQEYLMARWADVKATFQELSQRAINRFTSNEKAKISKDIVELKAKLENIENEAILKFA